MYLSYNTGEREKGIGLSQPPTTAPPLPPPCANTNHNLINKAAGGMGGGGGEANYLLLQLGGGGGGDNEVDQVDQEPSGLSNLGRRHRSAPHNLLCEFYLGPSLGMRHRSGLAVPIKGRANWEQ